ncbi:MAG: transporter substrate-binding domain-containing protein [Muribaculaceae bacterium]|jgi:ABC-type amino acid transport substrate-binding protein|nr:transporter substrate-binding domain-containing protein [Muribaculaceae bacterium]
MKYFVLSILLLFVTFGGFSQPKKNCDEKRTIHIVVEKDLWPFEFVNEKGEPDGFDVDMFKAVMNRAGYKYKMSVTSWDKVLLSGDSINGDMSIALYYSEKRAKQYLFSTPYGTIPMALISRRSDDFKTLDAIKSKRIIMKHDFLYNLAVASGMTNIIPTNSIEDGLRMLSDKKADAMIANEYTCRYLMEHKDIKNLTWHPSPFETISYCFAVKTCDSKLLNSINEALNSMMFDGTYKHIHNKWFSSYEGGYKFPHWIITVICFAIILIIALIGFTLHFRFRLARMTKNILKEKELAEKRDNMKSAFIANMGSEIRAPLNAIVGFAQLVGTIDDPQERQSYVDELESNSTTLTSLVNGILDLSKIESGTTHFTYSDFDISYVCHDMFDSEQTTNNNKDIQYVLELSEEHLDVYSDMQRIAQVTQILLKNAKRFTEKGNITMRTERSDNFAKVSVIDTGVGIAENELDNLFQRYFRTDENKSVDGTGLNLSLCRAIIVVLGGEIGVNSKPGQGSTFWFKIPLK